MSAKRLKKKKNMLQENRVVDREAIKSTLRRKLMLSNDVVEKRIMVSITRRSGVVFYYSFNKSTL